MGNTFGHFFRVTTFGESHGVGLGAIIDGCPPRIPLKEADIQYDLDRRRPGAHEHTSERAESDRVKILSGVFEGKTLGTPIALLVFNEDARSRDYEKLRNEFRKGHADEAWQKKFGIRDFRGGGRASGRETVSRVMAGAVAKKVLDVLLRKHFGKPLKISSRVAEVQGTAIKSENDLIKVLMRARANHDSVGATAEVTVAGIPAGLGDPVFAKLSATLGKALFSIGGVKAVQFGAGEMAAALSGSAYGAREADLEGLSGGISTGKPLSIRISFKPPSGILNKKSVQNRHDPCLLPRALPVLEAMTSMTLLDHYLAFRATNW